MRNTKKLILPSGSTLPIKMRQARTAMTLRSSFFAGVGLRLEYEPDPTVCTSTTDGKTFRINPDYFEALPFNQAVGLLALKSYQCAATHHVRMIGRDPVIANKASAYVSAMEVRGAGFELPEGHLYDERFRGMSFERVCNILEREKEQEPPPPPMPSQQGEGEGSGTGEGDGSAPDTPEAESAPEQSAGGNSGDDEGQDGDDQGDGSQENGQDGNEDGDQDSESGGPGQGGGDGGSGGNPMDQLDIGNCGSIQEPRSAEGRKMNVVELSREKQGWDQALSMASMASRRIGDIPGAAETLARANDNNEVDWVEQTRQFMRNSVSNNYSWTKPDRRLLPDWIPSLHSERMLHLLIASDTSASVMTERQIRIITNEVNGLLLEVLPVRLTLMYCDAIVQAIEEYTADEFPIDLHLRGHGGTRVSPVFQWIEDEGETPTCVIYFTDLEVWAEDFPLEPDYPVLWASTNRAYAPWGEVIMLDEI